MTLAGTRPPTVDEWDKYELHHRARLATKVPVMMWSRYRNIRMKQQIIFARNIIGNRVNAYTSDMDFHGGSKLSKLTYPIKTIYSKEARVQLKAIELDGTMICHSAEPHPRRDEYYENNITYHGSRYRQPFRNRN